MKHFQNHVLTGLLLLCSTLAGATIFGNVRGIVQDPQERPVGGARVTIHAVASAWSQTTKASPEGEFEFDSVPAGQYVVTVVAEGFSPMEQRVGIASDTAPILHFPLTLAPLAQQILVTESPEPASTVATGTQTIVVRAKIAQTPGLTALNATNHRYLQDEGNSFEGTRYADPRRVALELRYRFHY